MSEIAKIIVAKLKEDIDGDVLKMELIIKDIWKQGVDAGLNHAKTLYKQCHPEHNGEYIHRLDQTEIEWSQP